MTDQYIITGEWLKSVEFAESILDSEYHAKLILQGRSHPYNPQVEELTENQKTSRALREATHDYKIRRDEREKALDEFDVWMDKYFSYLSNQKNIPKGLFSGFGIAFDFRQKLKELRQEGKDGD